MKKKIKNKNKNKIKFKKCGVYCWFLIDILYQAREVPSIYTLI